MQRSNISAVRSGMRPGWLAQVSPCVKYQTTTARPPPFLTTLKKNVKKLQFYPCISTYGPVKYIIITFSWTKTTLFAGEKPCSTKQNFLP